MTDPHERDDDEPEHDAGHPSNGGGDGDGTTAESPPRTHPAIFASNWRMVLVVDAAMGLLVVAAGVVVAVAWNLVAGGLLGSLGVAYVFAVVRRGRQWGQLRREAGL